MQGEGKREQNGFWQVPTALNKDAKEIHGKHSLTEKSEISWS